MSIPFEIIIDTREKKPLFLSKIGDNRFPGLKIRFETLKTGDYSIVSMSSPSHPYSVAIERKSMIDLFGSTGRGHDRLEREFIRMSKFDHAEFVIEADLREIFQNPPTISMMRPKAVYRTMVAFSQRYNVKMWPCPDRCFVEQHIFITLKRFWDDRQKGGKQEFCKI